MSTHHSYDDTTIQSIVSNVLQSPINNTLKNSYSNNTLSQQSNGNNIHFKNQPLDNIRNSGLKKSLSSHTLSMEHTTETLNPHAAVFNNNTLTHSFTDLSLSHKQRTRTLNDIQQKRNAYTDKLNHALLNGVNSNNQLPSAKQLHTQLQSDVDNDAHSITDTDDNSRVLFVGDLARTVTEDELRHIFSTVGHVTVVDIKRDKITHNNLGYGFIHYSTRQQAKDAKRTLQNYELHGRRIRIGWAQKNTTLFIGDLDGKVTSEQLRAVFSQYGEISDEGTFVKDGSGKYGFVEFKHRADAEIAKQSMNKQIVGSRPIRIGWGDNQVQKCCVHIQYDSILGQHLQEHDFRPLFEPFGYIVTITMPRTLNHNGKQQLNNKSYCFIHYTDSDEGEDAATEAIAQLQDCTLHGVQLHLSYGKRQIYSKHKKERDARAMLLHSDTRSIGSSTYGSTHTYGSQQPPMYNNHTHHNARNKPLLNINHIDVNYLQHGSHHAAVQYGNTPYNPQTMYNKPQHVQYNPQTQYMNHQYMQSPIQSTTQLPSTHSNTSNHFNFNVTSPAITSMNDTLSPNIQPQPQFFLPHLDQTPALSAQPTPSYNLSLTSPHYHSSGNYYLPSSFISPAGALNRQASDTASVLSQYESMNLNLVTPVYAPSQLHWQTSQPLLVPLTPAATSYNDEHTIHSIREQHVPTHTYNNGTSTEQHSILNELRTGAINADGKTGQDHTEQKI